MAQNALRLAIAYGLAIPIGWNREKELHRAGIRTIPIVAIASCGLVILAQHIPNSDPGTFSRILQGLVTGIGFVGGGALLKEKGRYTGTATAATIWGMGIIGAAVGLGSYDIAIALTVLSFITLKFLAPVKQELDSDRDV